MCGLQHAYMEAPVIVQSDADFQAWVAAETGLSANPAERGQKMVRDLRVHCLP